MLAIYVTQELERLASDGRIVLYLFCDSSDPKRNTALSILCGLLYQLLQQQKQLACETHDYFNASNKASDTLSSVESLWKVFDILVQKLGAPVYCVLDGLDECDEKSLNILLKKFKQLFSRTDPDAGPQRVKLLVLSRDWPPFIQRQLNGFRRLNLDATAEVHSDLDRFIAAKVDELDNQSLDIQLSEACLGNVRRRLKEGVEGTFLWVAYVADELKDRTEEDVEEILQSVPKGLYGMYRRMLQQIRIDKEKVAAILTWVVLAREPLSVAELAAATRVEGSDTQNPEQKMMNRVRSCGRLLRVENGKVLLIHQSANDYLLRDAPYDRDFDVYHVNEDEGHLTLAKTCLRLMADIGFEYYGDYSGAHEHLMKSKYYPLVAYANSYELLHVSFASERSFTHAAKAAFFMTHLTIMGLTRSALWAVDGSGDAITLLCFAVCHGTTPWASYLLKDTRRNDLEMEDAYGQKPLSQAAQQGQTGIVKLLLDKGADVNARDTSGFDMTPLHWASRLGSEDVVALLLERGASSDAIAFGDRTPLSWAIENGSNSVLRLLLTKNPNLNYSYRIFSEPTARLKWMVLFAALLVPILVPVVCLSLPLALLLQSLLIPLTFAALSVTKLMPLVPPLLAPPLQTLETPQGTLLSGVMLSTRVKVKP